MKYWIIFLALITCHTKSIFSQDTTAVYRIIDDVKTRFAPDARTSVFAVKLKTDSKQIILQGEIYGEKLHKELMTRIQALPSKNEIKDSITILPSKALTGKTQGVITLSVANIRTRPAEAAEMATQALLGTPVQVLDKSGSWLRVQTPDKYIGWTPQASLHSMDNTEWDLWKNAKKVIYTKIYGFSYAQPDASGQTVSDLVAGDILEIAGVEGNYYKILYPDHREGYLSKAESMPLEEWTQSRTLTGESIVKTAKLFMGIPYLWGGTSPKGMDCSGFSKTVYFLNGKILSRDASQQVFEGTPVDISSGYENIKPGDLLFFGEKASDGKKERVVHVAISLGGAEFLHASGFIRHSSLDPKSPDYDEYNTKRLLRVKRMIP